MFFECKLSTVVSQPRRLKMNQMAGSIWSLASAATTPSWGGSLRRSGPGRSSSIKPARMRSNSRLLQCDGFEDLACWKIWHVGKLDKL